MGASHSAPSPPATDLHAPGRSTHPPSGRAAEADAGCAKGAGQAAATTAASRDGVGDSPAQGLTGMALVNYSCRKPKRRYRKCLNDFYSREFVTGRSMEQDCQEPFELYKECILRGIRAEIWDKQGLPPPKEGSPLAEVDDGNR